MNSEDVLFAFLIVILGLILIVVIGAFLMVAIWIPTVLGLNGLMWWAVAITTYFVLVGVSGGFMVKKGD